MLENIYWALIIGFISGALTRVFYRKMNMGELFSAMTVGLIGSVLFGWLGSLVRFYEYGDQKSLVASTVGSVLASGLYAWIFQKNKPTS